jgi:hypothetical protein
LYAFSWSKRTATAGFAVPQLVDASSSYSIPIHYQISVVLTEILSGKDLSIVGHIFDAVCDPFCEQFGIGVYQ